jgi:ABC-type antimicrobial peptide transport system permease subunit
MSFTVTKRRREIGIRSALGADPRRIIMSVFARAGAQIGAGVLAGTTFVAALWALDWQDPGGRLENEWILLPCVAALMIVVGLLAALGPARRGLAVQPTEAMREE